MGNVSEGKEVRMVLVKGFLVSVQPRECADVLITGHMMMMVAVNDTSKRNMNNTKGRIYGIFQ